MYEGISARDRSRRQKIHAQNGHNIYIIITTCRRTFCPHCISGVFVCIHPWEGLLKRIYTRAWEERYPKLCAMERGNIGNSSWIYGNVDMVASWERRMLFEFMSPWGVFWVCVCMCVCV
jgi:hypothetical protein